MVSFHYGQISPDSSDLLSDYSLIPRFTITYTLKGNTTILKSKKFFHIFHICHQLRYL